MNGLLFHVNKPTNSLTIKLIFKPIIFTNPWWLHIASDIYSDDSSSTQTDEFDCWYLSEESDISPSLQFIFSSMCFKCLCMLHQTSNQNWGAENLFRQLVCAFRLFTQRMSINHFGWHKNNSQCIDESWRRKKKVKSHMFRWCFKCKPILKRYLVH